MSGVRDYELVWADAPRLPDEIVEQLGDVFVRHGGIQDSFVTFERFARWWVQRHIEGRQRAFALTPDGGDT